VKKSTMLLMDVIEQMPNRSEVHIPTLRDRACCQPFRSLSPDGFETHHVYTGRKGRPICVAALNKTIRKARTGPVLPHSLLVLPVAALRLSCFTFR
jgi:hypothetical protein